MGLGVILSGIFYVDAGFYARGKGTYIHASRTHCGCVGRACMARYVTLYIKMADKGIR